MDSVIPFVLDTDVRERIIAEAGGNPLALLELPRGLLTGAAELAASLLSCDDPCLDRIDDTFRRRLAALPAGAARGSDAGRRPRSRLAIPAVVLRVRRGRSASSRARRRRPKADGLIEIGARVRFRHPLVRVVRVPHGIAGRAPPTPTGRWRTATDPDVDPDRRAWHLAQAATGPDDDVAAELERSASRAQARGGFAAAAAFLERAAALTLGADVTGAARALAAAQLKHLAGAHGAGRRDAGRSLSRARSTKRSGPRLTCFAPRSPSLSAAATMHLGCSYAPPSGSSRSMLAPPAPPTWTPSWLHTSPGRLARGDRAARSG